MQERPRLIQQVFLQGAFGCQVKPGATLQGLLRSHSAAHIIQDAVCAWCSLTWTLLGHQRSTDAQQSLPVASLDSADGDWSHRDSQAGSQELPKAASCGEQCACSGSPQQGEQPSAEESSSCVSQPSTHQGTGPSMPSMPSIASHQHQQPAAVDSGPSGSLPSMHLGTGSGMDAMRLLERCLHGSVPLPEADVESMAKRAGLCWVQSRGPLLTRTLIAQAPKVCVYLSAPTLGLATCMRQCLV